MKKPSILKGVVLGLGAVGAVALGAFGVKKYQEVKEEKEVREPQTPREGLEEEIEKMAEEISEEESLAEEAEKEENKKEVKKIITTGLVAGGLAVGAVGLAVGGFVLYEKISGKDKGDNKSEIPIEEEEILYTGYKPNDKFDDMSAEESEEDTVEKEGDATKDGQWGGYNPYQKAESVDLEDDTSNSFKK